MNREELLKLKSEKESIKEKLQATFHQISGQLILIDELLLNLEKGRTNPNEPNNL